jgi:hypothetical protein
MNDRNEKMCDNNEDNELETVTEKYFPCDDAGNDVQFVEYRCTRIEAGGTLLMITCAIFALRCLNFLKIFILIKFSIGLFLLLKLFF